MPCLRAFIVSDLSGKELFMGSGDISQFSGLVRKAARHLMRGVRGSLDSCGNGREDYEQILWTTVLTSQRKWREREESKEDPAQEVCWVTASVWNMVRDIFRRRANQPDVVADGMAAYEDVDATMQARLESRSALRWLLTLATTARQEEIFYYMVENGGKPPTNFCSGKDYIFIQRVRAFAKESLLSV